MPNQMDVEYSVFCNGCDEQTDVVRLMEYPILPPILVIHLNTFTNDLKKVFPYFSIQFQMDCFCSKCLLHIQDGDGDEPPHRYVLCCIVFHVGRLISNGHYFSVVRSTDNAEHIAAADQHCCANVNRMLVVTTQVEEEQQPQQQQEKWLKCDDEKITSISRDQLNNLLAKKRYAITTPYLLFYVRSEQF